MELEPTKRFTNRVENYVKYRPHYPTAVLTYLRSEWGLAPDHVVADIGSGTGFLTLLFLDDGNHVYGVEPNDAMRAAAERLLAGYDNFTSVKATAESTTLPPNHVDFVTAGQAFHWFDAGQARAEFRRILKPGGTVVLVWNERKYQGDPLMADYEALLRQHGIGYGQVSQRGGEKRIDDFYQGPYAQRTVANEQHLDFEGLKGRFLSSSYAPLPGQPGHEAMMRGLRELFERYEENGRVRFRYNTQVYVGLLKRDDCGICN